MASNGSSHVTMAQLQEQMKTLTTHFNEILTNLTV
jgi:hypothetical protein